MRWETPRVDKTGGVSRVGAERVVVVGAKQKLEDASGFVDIYHDHGKFDFGRTE